MNKAKLELPEVRYCRDAYKAATAAEALLVLTEWPEFRSVDWDRLHGLMIHALDC